MAELEVQKLLVDSLTSGAVLSYVDLFYLSRRPRTRRDDAGDSPSFLATVKTHLAASEAARRKGDTSTVISHYSKLAQLYRGAEQHKIAIFYLEKCLDIARAVSDVAKEQAAQHSLGLANEALHEHALALEHHETHRSLAENAEDAHQIVLACAQLVRVYRKLATIAESRGEGDEALRLHLLALGAARECGDIQAEAKANYSVGRAYVLQKVAGDGIPYLKNFLRISSATPGAEDQTAAGYAGLAAAYAAVQNYDAAAECLEELVSAAERTGNVAAQAEAAENLGIMHAQQGHNADAEPSLARAYELRKQLLAAGTGSRPATDKARILLGMVRGDARVAPLFRHILAVDVPGLLGWKAHTADLAAASGEGAGQQAASAAADGLQ